MTYSNILNKYVIYIFFEKIHPPMCFQVQIYILKI